MFCADLHIHSRFSRATSSRLTLPNLAVWAGLKGIDVLGTGDFTHPAWREELREGLLRDEASGLYRLKRPIDGEDVQRETGLVGVQSKEPLFVLQGEISSIYKRSGAVRKVHSVIFAPDLAAADKLSARLESLGNIRSDGRPILGLDVKDLLEITLEAGGLLVPAHIWTPWFSLFGSKSGFDSLEECFGDLSKEIFALETGLSSDPDMNHCWSQLDHLALISNSDAHSGENLGREANLFSGSPSWNGMFEALRRSGQSQAFSQNPEPGSGHDVEFLGTLEFFPEEGKYHLDGHRACNVMLEPEETRRLGGMCPACGKPLTVGVLHRVLALADRKEPPLPGAGFRSLVPLAEILGEILGCGPKTKKPQQKLAEIQARFGPELHVLMDADLGDISRWWPELGEGLRRMRHGQVIRQGGYDGEYGVIRLFDQPPSGKAKPRLISLPAGEKKPRSLRLPEKNQKKGEAAPSHTPSLAQKSAMEAGPQPVLVLAGPGSGKTRTLAGRVAWLVHGQKKTLPQHIAAITFTRRAAAELRQRLSDLAGEDARLVAADTLHALALEHWPGPRPVLLSEAGAKKALALACPDLPPKAWEIMSLARECLALPPEHTWLAPALAAYHAWKEERHLADYTDLPERWLQALRAGAPRPWAQVLVDEIQDLSPLQLALLAALLPADGTGFFGIGDPDQAIYGFRGAAPDVAGQLTCLWPQMRVFELSESYRSSAGILESGQALLGPRPLRSVTGKDATRLWLEAPGAEQEAAWVAERIAGLVGGTSHSAADSQADLKSCHLDPGSCSLGDIAILLRLKSLMLPFQKALERKGIPCAMPESEAFWLDSGVQALLADAAAFVATAGVESPALPLPVPASLWQSGPSAVLALLKERAPVFCASPAFAALAREYQGRLWPDILADLALRQELDMVRAKAEKVQIMTLHAAKGLEFKAVFLPCLEEGILPFAGADALMQGKILSPQELAEERRLLYVGITRASEALFASCAARRRIYGREFTLPPSSLIPHAEFQTINLVRHVKTKREQLSLC